MMREISIFTGSTDIERALGLLRRTAAAEHRALDNRMELAELARWFGRDDSTHRLSKLALELGVEPFDAPDPAAVRSLFDDELLSARALKLHRGRNVYSGGKKALWDRLWLPFRDALTPADATLALTGELVAMRSHAGGPELRECARRVGTELEEIGFKLELHVAPGHPTVLVARRPAQQVSGHLIMYGHYDVEKPDEAAWDTDPWRMTERDGRLYGVGIGDNKAALAQRIVTLREIDATPAITWIIQGEEEAGSPLLRHIIPDVVKEARAQQEPTLWLDENGYFDLDGTQRMLAKTAPASDAPGDPPDAGLWRIIEALADDARRYTIDYRLECRGLNKSFFPAGCPFGNAMPPGARYLAIGLNDPSSRIHQANESVPMWTFPLAARQFKTVLRMVTEVAAVQR